MHDLKPNSHINQQSQPSCWFEYDWMVDPTSHRILNSGSFHSRLPPFRLTSSRVLFPSARVRQRPTFVSTVSSGSGYLGQPVIMPQAQRYLRWWRPSICAGCACLSVCCLTFLLYVLVRMYVREGETYIPPGQMEPV